MKRKGLAHEPSADQNILVPQAPLLLPAGVTVAGCMRWHSQDTNWRYWLGTDTDTGSELSYALYGQGSASVWGFEIRTDVDWANANVATSTVPTGEWLIHIGSWSGANDQIDFSVYHPSGALITSASTAHTASNLYTTNSQRFARGGDPRNTFTFHTIDTGPAKMWGQELPHNLVAQDMIGKRPMYVDPRLHLDEDGNDASGKKFYSLYNNGRAYVDGPHTFENSHRLVYAKPATTVTGTANITLDSATLSSAGTVLVDGTVSATLDALTSNGVGAVDVDGATTALLGDVTLSSAGMVATVGSLSVTLDDATVSSAGAVAVDGTATPTLDAATASSAGTVDVTGTATPTLADVTSNGVGAVDVDGTAAITLGDLTLSATGTTGPIGTLVATLADVTVNGAGTVVVDATATPTLGAATLSSAGTVDVDGAATPTLGDVTSSSAGGVLVTGTATNTLGALTVSSTAFLDLFAMESATMEIVTTAWAAKAVTDSWTNESVSTNWTAKVPK